MRLARFESKIGGAYDYALFRGVGNSMPGCEAVPKTVSLRGGRRLVPMDGPFRGGDSTEAAMAKNRVGKYLGMQLLL